MCQANLAGQLFFKSIFVYFPLIPQIAIAASGSYFSKGVLGARVGSLDAGLGVVFVAVRGVLRWQVYCNEEQ